MRQLASVTTVSKHAVQAVLPKFQREMYSNNLVQDRLDRPEEQHQKGAVTPEKINIY